LVAIVRTGPVWARVLVGLVLFVVLLSVVSVLNPPEDASRLAGGESATPRATASPTPTASPEVFTDVPVGWPKPPDGAQEAFVAKVTDGDTIVLKGIDIGEIDAASGGHKTRLIGIDTPEVFGGEECYGAAASAFTKGELAQRSVLVDFDVEKTDRYGRALAYVWTQDGRFFNARLAAEGYAQQLTIPPNVRYAELFSTLVREARESNRGLWGGCGAEGGGVDTPTQDKDCSDFATHEEAQSFFESQGGPSQDPHNLDSDNDGLACEGSQGSAAAQPTAAPATQAPSGGNCHASYPDFCIPPPPPDKDCGDIGREFTVRWDVPDPDPHGFDADHDGRGCESY
jgi:micrococcal nuclease